MQKTTILKSCLIYVLSCVMSGVLPIACIGPAQPEALSVLTWNVEALFDGYDDGIEYAEYRAAQGWNEEKYRSRLTAIAKAFEQVEGGAPDIAVFIELENEGVLNLLAGEYLAKYGYQHGYFTKKDGQSLGIGILSRYPVTKALCHSYYRDGNVIPRPISEVWIEAQGEELVILVCHWKSKLGKPETSQALRDDAATLIRRISGDIRAERENEDKTPVPILLAGDFNQTTDEFFVDGFPFLTTRDRGDFRQTRTDEPLFWTPWGTELEGGSYYYREEWESIDHFFLSGAFFDGRAWDYGSVKTLKDTPWTGSNEIPQSFNPQTGNGLSDHVPLLLTLTLHSD
jgi:endonuclease/exonuclease/phosphatase family metal-dependent hydrolase